jgi:putative hydrolase of the HAD superfamily
VTFDWWHTVVAPWEDAEAWTTRTRVSGIQEVLARHGIALSYAALEEAYEGWTRELVAAWRRGVDFRPERQVRNFLRWTGHEDVDGPIRRDLEEPFGRPLLQRPPRPVPHVAACLAALKARGLRIGLVSNTGRTWGKVLRVVKEKLGLAAYFDVLVYSDEVEVRKPRPAIFRHALRLLDLPASDVVHVGDDLDADVGGAKGVGMGAVWYRGARRQEGASDLPDAAVDDLGALPALLEGW